MDAMSGRGELEDRGFSGGLLWTGRTGWAADYEILDKVDWGGRDPGRGGGGRMGRTGRTGRRGVIRGGKGSLGRRAGRLDGQIGDAHVQVDWPLHVLGLRGF